MRINNILNIVVTIAKVITIIPVIIKGIETIINEHKREKERLIVKDSISRDIVQKDSKESI